MDYVEFYSFYGIGLYLLFFLPWGGLVLCAAWCVWKGKPKAFLPCVVVVALATTALFVSDARSVREVVLGLIAVPLLWVLPQAGLLAFLIRRRSRPLVMLAATLALWVVQLPASIAVLFWASCTFLQNCL